jgi:branched-subunit amino acid ABC-type transport system permease component
VIEEALGQLPVSLLASSLYAMAATGLTLNFMVTRFSDFAVGEYLTVGCYVAALLTIQGIDPLTSLFASGLAASLVALAADELGYKRLEIRGATVLQVFIAAVGVSLFIRYVISSIADIYDVLFLTSRFRLEALTYLGNRPFTNLHLLAVTSLVLTIVVLTYLSYRTKTGKAMRAIASNRNLALSSGIPIWRIRAFTRLIMGFLAGVSGALWAYYTSINPESGWRLLLWVFAAAIIGNLTNFPLTVVGGLLIGFTENLGMWGLSRMFGLETAYKPLIPYLAIAVVLLYRNRRRIRRVIEE